MRSRMNELTAPRAFDYCRTGQGDGSRGVESRGAGLADWVAARVASAARSAARLRTAATSLISMAAGWPSTVFDSFVWAPDGPKARRRVTCSWSLGDRAGSVSARVPRET